MAIWVIAVVGAAPCQCFSPGGIQRTSPGRISSIGPPQRRARPQPAVTSRVCPSGWVCHAVRAPGSKVTLAPTTRAGAGGLNSGSTRTAPVKYSAGPLPEGCEPFLLMSILESPHVAATALLDRQTRVPAPAPSVAARSLDRPLHGQASDRGDLGCDKPLDFADLVADA